MRSIPFAWLMTCGALSADPIAGAWETFSTQTSAGAWKVFDYEPGTFSVPLWASEDANPFIFASLNGNPSHEESGRWFVADEAVASGAFVGDYGGQKISGIRVRIFTDPSELGELDCAILATGPANAGEPEHYFSEFVLGDDLEAGTGWYEVEFPFSVPWYYVENGGFSATPVTSGMLATIGEIGFRFIPRNGLVTTSFVGIDDVILIPSDEPPVLTPAVAGGNFTLAFTPAPGTSCAIQTAAAGGLADWGPVAGQANITGSSAHLFQTPVTPGKAFFRVESVELLTPVATP